MTNEQEKIETASDHARARVIHAGVGWCLFSHHHDNSQAAISAAITALEILQERMAKYLVPKTNTYEGCYVFIDICADINQLLAELSSRPGNQTSMEPTSLLPSAAPK